MESLYTDPIVKSFYFYTNSIDNLSEEVYVDLGITELYTLDSLGAWLNTQWSETQKMPTMISIKTVVFNRHQMPNNLRHL